LTPAGLEQPLTRRYILEYSTPGGLAWLNRTLNNGGIYLPFIREEIAKRNLPPELIYLPVIESGYLATARSKSGASGLWQFMLNSIAPFEMQVTDLVDERRDFRKSTIGALRKLEDNYRAMGNWPLALAAYNAGLGAVSRAVQRTGSRDYWQLCEQKELRNETIHYVPRLLAVAYILSQPRRFGAAYWPESIAWTSIPVRGQASLELIAAETGIDRKLLGRLNAELLHALTPEDAAYRLKIPAAQAETVAALLEREGIPLVHLRRHQVQYGDTLSSLARRYGIPLAQIERFNPGISGRYLQIGETLAIPATGEAPPPPAASPSEDRPFTGLHIVKRGETLWSVAIRYGLEPPVLARENGMELGHILPEGKLLKVPIIEHEEQQQSDE
jgi:membrane-bound lytic murein transglycosylase D